MEIVNLNGYMSVRKVWGENVCFNRINIYIFVLDCILFRKKVVFFLRINNYRFVFMGIGEL